jgi:tetratricopeptide (TPR) repeat protein
VSQGNVHEVARETVARFAAGQATAEERLLVLRHLLAGCELCQGFLRPPPVRAACYDAAFAKVEAQVLKVLAKEAAERLFRELEAIPAEQRELRARNSPRFASVDLAEVLADRSIAAGSQDARDAWLYARLAVVAAEGAAAASSERSEALHDALAKAWGALGNAHRLRSELPEADRAFATAFGHLALGSGTPAARAWVCLYFFSLRLFRREFAEARALALEAAAIYQSLRDTAGEAAARIKLAIVSIHAGDPEAALESLDRGIALARSCGEENLCRLAIGNLVRCYIDLGRLREAHALFLATGVLFELCTEGIVALKWRWHGALIERDLGLLEPAAARLVEVREGLFERGLRVEIADVSLDLISVYLRMGDAAGVLRTVGETIPIYQAVGATRELLATLIEMTQIAHQQEQALGVLAAVSEQIRALLPENRG